MNTINTIYVLQFASFNNVFYLFYIYKCIIITKINHRYCCCLVTKQCLTLLRRHGVYSTRLLCPLDFPGKNTGVGCHFFLQRIFPTQGSNLSLLHCRQILYQLSYEGSPIALIKLFCAPVSFLFAVSDISSNFPLSLHLVSSCLFIF